MSPSERKSSDRLLAHGLFVLTEQHTALTAPRTAARPPAEMTSHRRRLHTQMTSHLFLGDDVSQAQALDRESSRRAGREQLPEQQQRIQPPPLPRSKLFAPDYWGRLANPPHNVVYDDVCKGRRRAEPCLEDQDAAGEDGYAGYHDVVVPGDPGPRQPDLVQGQATTDHAQPQHKRWREVDVDHRQRPSRDGCAAGMWPP